MVFESGYAQHKNTYDGQMRVKNIEDFLTL